jgi:hypothetical protein
MFKSIDRSERLLRFVKSLSSALARYRGLPVVIGIIFVIIAFAIQIINVYADSQLLELLGVIVQYVGLLTALIGLLLADPLGK